MNKKISITKNHVGFTLIEIIISISIASLLLILVTASYRLSHQIYVSTDTKAEITQNGRVILDRMVREIRQTPDIVTEIPLTNDNPESLPEEIMFQDGHDTLDIKYIRYYLDNNNIKKQIIVYYFDIDPTTYVFWHVTDEDGGSPTMEILEDKIIGEYVYDLELWGDELININLYLLKNNQFQTINTAVYGRNL